MGRRMPLGGVLGGCLPQVKFQIQHIWFCPLPFSFLTNVPRGGEKQTLSQGVTSFALLPVMPVRSAHNFDAAAQNSAAVLFLLRPRGQVSATFPRQSRWGFLHSLLKGIPGSRHGHVT